MRNIFAKRDRNLVEDRLTAKALKVPIAEDKVSKIRREKFETL